MTPDGIQKLGKQKNKNMFPEKKGKQKRCSPGNMLLFPDKNIWKNYTRYHQILPEKNKYNKCCFHDGSLMMFSLWTHRDLSIAINSNETAMKCIPLH